MSFDLDLFVIGGGSAGVRAAKMAAISGARVALAEEHRMGGTCVIRGCVPKKLMVYASSFGEMMEDAAGFGWDVGPAVFDWPRFIAAKDREIDRLEGLYRGALVKYGVTTHDARATIEDPHTVALSTGQRLTARHILIATGGWPQRPEVPGAALGITSNEVFHLATLPRRIVIVGGGYIACEFACVFHGMGSEVTLVHRGPHILRGFDHDVRTHVETAMRTKGIGIRLMTQVMALSEAQGGILVQLTGGEEAVADTVLFATGRVPNSAGLGLAALGVEIRANGAIEVDPYSQTSIPSIFAVGDVTDRLPLTPVAIREGAAFVETVFNARPTKAEHVLVPTAVFTQPEIGTVGMSEEAARAEGPVTIYRTVFRPMMHALSGRTEKMLMKLVVDAVTRRVLGCHIVGHGAGEMIQLAAVALRLGATKEDFDRTVAVHPTAAEELVTLRDPVT